MAESSVKWKDYEPYDPGVDRPLHEVGRTEARAAFKRLMDAKAHRIDELRVLLDRNGVPLDSSSQGLQSVNGWFFAAITGNRDTGRLDPIWYSVVNDLGLYLGEIMIERAPGLRWEMFDRGKADSSFQRAVIMGFTSVQNPKYNVDIDFLVGSYAHRVVLGNEVSRDMFPVWVETAVARA